MKLRVLKRLIAQAENDCTGDADDCEITIVDANDIEYDIGNVEDEEGERIIIFVEQMEEEETSNED